MRFTEFTIATIAPENAELQDYAREFEERHQAEGLLGITGIPMSPPNSAKVWRAGA